MIDHDSIRQELLEVLLERFSREEIEEQGYLDHDPYTMTAMIQFWEKDD